MDGLVIFIVAAALQLSSASPSLAITIVDTGTPTGHDAKEHFGVFLLSSETRMLGFHPVATGTLTATLVIPHEIFGAALRTLGCGRIILVHNHPSGDPEASYDDIDLTKTLVKAGRLLDVHVIDHVIVASGTHRFSSLAQQGVIVDAAHKDAGAADTCDVETVTTAPDN